MINDDSSSKEGSRESNREHLNRSSRSSSSASSPTLASSRRGSKIARSSQPPEKARNDISSASCQTPLAGDDRSQVAGLSKEVATANVRDGAPEESPASGLGRGGSSARQRQAIDGETDKSLGDNNTGYSLANPESSSQKNDLQQPSTRMPEDKMNPIQARPVGKLIRRDDSWQSLSSLARVGKVVPTAVQGKCGARMILIKIYHEAPFKVSCRLIRGTLFPPILVSGATISLRATHHAEQQWRTGIGGSLQQQEADDQHRVHRYAHQTTPIYSGNAKFIWTNEIIKTVSGSRRVSDYQFRFAKSATNSSNDGQSRNSAHHFLSAETNATAATAQQQQRGLHKK